MFKLQKEVFGSTRFVIYLFCLMGAYTIHPQPQCRRVPPPMYTHFLELSNLSLREHGEDIGAWPLGGLLGSAGAGLGGCLGGGCGFGLGGWGGFWFWRRCRCLFLLLLLLLLLISLPKHMTNVKWLVGHNIFKPRLNKLVVLIISKLYNTSVPE